MNASSLLSTLGRPLSVALVILFSSGSTAAQLPSIYDQDNIRDLVVDVFASFEGGDPIQGAGIVFDLGPGNRIYIATARHVVYRKHDNVEAQVNVKFKALLPGLPIKATVLELELPTDLDLAVLSVHNLPDIGIPVEDLEFEWLGDPAALRVNDTVFSLGNPVDGSLLPDPSEFVELTPQNIFFSGKPLGGHSGGALLDARWQIVGLVIRKVSNGGVAIRIDRIVKILESQTFTPDLRQPPAAFDLAKIALGEDHYSVIIPGGAEAGKWTRTTTEFGADQFHHVGELVVWNIFHPEFSKNPEEALIWEDKTAIEFDQKTLNPVSLKKMGRDAEKKPFSINVAYKTEHRVTGTINFPLPDGIRRKGKIDKELGVRVIDSDLLVVLAPTLELADGVTHEVRTYDAVRDTTFSLKVIVGGPESVKVPAGIFPAWRLDVRGGPSETVFWVRKGDRRLVKSALNFAGLLVTLELEP